MKKGGPSTVHCKSHTYFNFLWIRLGCFSFNNQVTIISILGKVNYDRWFVMNKTKTDSNLNFR